MPAAVLTPLRAAALAERNAEFFESPVKKRLHFTPSELDEVESTDVGSTCTSDTESTTCSTSGECVAGSRRAAEAGLRRASSLRVGKGPLFKSTPLDPIPGTPIRQPVCRSAALDHLRPQPIMATRPLPVVPVSDMGALPLKVWLPPHLQNELRHLDPARPVKKRPVYEEWSTSVGPLRFEPGLPLKKHTPDFQAPGPLLSTTPATRAPMPR